MAGTKEFTRFGIRNSHIGPAGNPAGAWEFLGRSAWVSGATVPSIFIHGKKHLWIRAIVGGIAAAGIPRIRFGGGAIDTGNNYATSLIQGVTLDATSVSVPGHSLCSTGITGRLIASLEVVNIPSVSKRSLGKAQHSSISAAVAPTQVQISGLWVDLTNQVGILDMANYDTLTATTVSANAFLAGTEFTVWGRDDD